MPFAAEKAANGTTVTQIGAYLRESAFIYVPSQENAVQVIYHPVGVDEEGRLYHKRAFLRERTSRSL